MLQPIFRRGIPVRSATKIQIPLHIRVRSRQASQTRQGAREGGNQARGFAALQQQGPLVRAAARGRGLRGAGQGVHRAHPRGLEETAAHGPEAARPGRRQLLDEDESEQSLEAIRVLQGEYQVRDELQRYQQEAPQLSGDGARASALAVGEPEGSRAVVGADEAPDARDVGVRRVPYPQRGRLLVGPGEALRGSRRSRHDPVTRPRVLRAHHQERPVRPLRSRYVIVLQRAESREAHEAEEEDSQPPVR